MLNILLVGVIALLQPPAQLIDETPEGSAPRELPVRDFEPPYPPVPHYSDLSLRAPHRDAWYASEAAEPEAKPEAKPSGVKKLIQVLSFAALGGAAYTYLKGSVAAQRDPRRFKRHWVCDRGSGYCQREDGDTNWAYATSAGLGAVGLGLLIWGVF